MGWRAPPAHRNWRGELDSRSLEMLCALASIGVRRQTSVVGRRSSVVARRLWVVSRQSSVVGPRPSDSRQRRWTPTSGPIERHIHQANALATFLTSFFMAANCHCRRRRPARNARHGQAFCLAATWAGPGRVDTGGRRVDTGGQVRFARPVCRPFVRLPLGPVRRPPQRTRCQSKQASAGAR